MGLIRNLLALIGLIVIIGLGTVWFKAKDTVAGFDPNALNVYTELAQNVVATQNAAEATVWKFPVAEGLSVEEVEETMRFVANEHNMSAVGELPLSKDVEAKSGKPYRFVKIYMFCNSLTAARMLDYSDAFSAYLPCRVTLLEDPQGKLWLYTLNMDLMIHGGATLPSELKEEAVSVKEKILDIMERGAAGDF